LPHFILGYAAIGANNRVPIFSLRNQPIDGAAALSALPVRADLADAVEDFELDSLPGKTREKAADGMGRPAVYRGNVSRFPVHARSFTWRSSLSGPVLVERIDVAIRQPGCAGL
jgi:hypothetical protein